eukprot:6192328-Pleurochrysis_carterae.AAC.3
MSNRKFFDVKPALEKEKELKGQIQQLLQEITSLKSITKPNKEYFRRDGFTIAVDLVIAESIATAQVSRNQLSALFLTCARSFRIKLPNHRGKVPQKVVDGKMTHIEKELLYILGEILNQARLSTRPQAHSGGPGAAADAQGKTRREARKARSTGRRARAHRSTTACRASTTPTSS